MQRLKLLFCIAVCAITFALPGAADETDRRETATYKKYGPWIGTAVQIGSKQDNVAFRGIVIPLSSDEKSGVVFDADTMRMAAGWLDGGLTLRGLPFDGGHGKFPHFGGKPLFLTRAAPGWGIVDRDGADALIDPRIAEQTGPWAQRPPLGPLPQTDAKYKGLYLFNDQVVLKYTVGQATVIESPALIIDGDHRGIRRELEITRDGQAMMLVLADVDGEADIQASTAVFKTPGSDRQTILALEKSTDGARIEQLEGRLVLRLPAAQGTSRFNIAYWQGGDAAIAVKHAEQAAVAPLKQLTAGGPSRWGQPIETQGELSTDDESPYALDRITVPYNNPFGSPMRIGGLDFFSDGTSAAVSTWDGEVWIVRGIDDDLDKVTWQRYATGLHEALGLKIVDDVIYAVSDMQITRFHDYNNDGEADFYENFNNDWDLTSGFHAFCFDLHTDQHGNFYFAFGSPVRGGGRSFERMGRHHGSIIKVSKDGSKLERYATGLRAPNGMGVSPTGQVTSGDNEGTFVPRCPIHWIEKDEFLGVVDSYAHFDQLKTTPTVGQLRGDKPQHLDVSEMPTPLAWLPKNVDNSGGGQAWITSDRWGPFQNEMLHMSYGQSSLYLVMKEQKGDIVQGGVVKMPVRFTSSAMRARFNAKDGQLYVAGLRGWQTNAAKNGGLDRVRYTGKPVNMPRAIKVKPGGIEISFTQKLDPETAADPDNYSIDAADIKWKHDYGSGDYQWGQRDTEPNKWKQGWAEMYVDDARLLPDGKTVFLEVADIQPVHQMKIQFQIKAADGTPIKDQIWNTIHVVD